MAITTELVGKLGGKGGYIWKPTPDINYDLGANFPSRIAISFRFVGSHGLYVNNVSIDSGAKFGFWILPDEKDIPNPRYVRISGGSAETGAGMFICVTPVENGLSAPPAA